MLSFLQKSFEALSDAILITEAEPLDEPGPRIVYANTAFERITGYSREEVIGKSPRFLQGPLTDRADLTFLRRALEGGKTVQRNLINYTKSGEEFWTELTISPILNEQGKATYYVAVQRDITERKMAERSGHSVDDRFRAFVSNSPLAGCIVDDAGHFYYISPGYYRMFGLDGQKCLGKHVREIHTGELAAFLSQPIRDLRVATIQETVIAVTRSDGSRGQFLILKFPIFQTGPNFLLGGLALDISQRIVTEERLEEQAALLDIAHEAILVKDMEDRIIYWNRGAERMYGWSAQEALGQKTAELLYGNKKFDDAHVALMERGEWNGEIIKKTKDGRLVYVDVRWTLVRDKEGKPKSVLAINSDITERKLLEAQFLRVQRMESIGTLASGIAHDLNNVLAPILLSIEILKSIVNDDEAQELLHMIKTSAEHGADLVKQVLFIGKGGGGEKIPVKVVRLLEDLHQILGDTFPKKINIGVTVDPSIASVKGDPTHLQQVLLNLCVNARDAMPDGGELLIKAEEQLFGGDPEASPGPYVVIEVSDSGIGIPLEIRDRIFEPFFTTKEVGQGTGLGLSTTQAIVKSHGGFIRFSSEEGVGTKFKVYLPADPDLEEKGLLEVDDLKLPRGSGELILVVDDEPAILKVAKSALEHYGYKVMIARNGAEAIYIYSQNIGSINLVLTDMAMPVMDGPSLIIQLRTKNPNVIIIGSSGLTSDSAVIQVTGIEVPYFVSKPYSTSQLLKTIRKAITDRSS